MISLRELSKRYGGTLAVDDLTFDVQAGRVTGFLGPNGAGKSTTMRMILGLDHPTRGRALIAGRPYADLRRPLRAVGAMLDARAVHPARSGRAHLVAQARSNGIPVRRVDEVIETVGLATAARRPAGTYSLGMSGRLGVARGGPAPNWPACSRPAPSRTRPTTPVPHPGRRVRTASSTAPAATCWTRSTSTGSAGRRPSGGQGHRAGPDAMTSAPATRDQRTEADVGGGAEPDYGASSCALPWA